MMTTRQMLGITFILLMTGLPLISAGAGGLLGWVGLLLILAGAALPPVARLASLAADPEKEESKD
jgi:hypothetical protein